MLPVFNVTDQDGNKLRDEGILDYISKVDVMICLYFSFSFARDLNCYHMLGGGARNFSLGLKIFQLIRWPSMQKGFNPGPSPACYAPKKGIYFLSPAIIEVWPTSQ